MLSLCCRAGCEDEKTKKEREKEEEKGEEVDVVDGEGSGCRGATTQGARPTEGGGERVVIQDLSRSL